MSRYLDSRSEIVFRKIFGEHPLLLKSFLNAILPLSPDGRIESLEYLPDELVPAIPAFKYPAVNAKCTDCNGRMFIAEVQLDWVNSFKQRISFNSANAYVQQLQKSESYELLCPVYGLGIVENAFKTNPAWYHHHPIVNVQDPAKRISGLELIFVELPKFRPLAEDEKRLRVLWLRFLSELNEKTRALPQEFLEVPEIREACRLAEEDVYTLGELEGYDRYWDAVSTAKTSAAGHFRRGFEQGKAEGLAYSRGILQAKLEIAPNLLAMNMSLSQIAAVLRLSQSDLEHLLASSESSFSTP